MANNYTIHVINKSGASQSYVLYQQAPAVDLEVLKVGFDVPKIFTSAYLTAPPIPTGSGTATFKPIKKYYAVCGTAPPKFGPGASVSVGDYEQVTLTTDKKDGTTTVKVDADDNIFFDNNNDDDNNNMEPKKAPSTYFIRTGDDLSGSKNYFLGLGAQDPNNDNKIVPVATFAAQASKTYEIAPISRYFIAKGTVVQGEVLDVDTIDRKATTERVTNEKAIIERPLMERATIDFTESNSNFTSARVVHNADGTYSVKLGGAMPAPVQADSSPPKEQKPQIPVGDGDITINLTLEWGNEIILKDFKKGSDTGGSTKAYLKEKLAKTQGTKEMDFSKNMKRNKDNVPICPFSFICNAKNRTEILKAVGEVIRGVAKEGIDEKLTKRANINSKDIIPLKSMSIMNGTISYDDDDGVPVAKRIEEGYREYDALFGIPDEEHTKISMRAKQILNGDGIANGDDKI